MTPKTTNVGRLASAAILALAACQASAADYGLIQNGGFETAQSGSLFTGNAFNLSGNAIQGWTIQGSVDAVPTGYWKAQEGNYSLDLNGSGSGTIQQVVSAGAGGQYTLSFWYAGNFEISADSRSFTAKIGSTDLGTFTVGTSGNAHLANPWTQFTQLVTLAPGDNILSFQSLESGPCGPVLDNVSLTAVPEPYQFGLASMIGLFGLVFVDRLRQRKLNG